MFSQTLIVCSSLFYANFVKSPKDYETAIKYFNIALKILDTAPPRLLENRAEIYFYRGTVNYELGKYQYAIQDYNQSIQIDPQTTSAYNNRGLSYAELGDYKRAVQDYDQAVNDN